MSERARVAIVALEFGAEFVPIYQRHPQAELYAVCHRNRELLDKVGDQFDIERRYTRFEDPLEDEQIDAIHIVSPLAAHADMTLAALQAGKQPPAPCPWPPPWLTVCASSRPSSAPARSI